ncbi:MAG: TetR family transcriptional regulator [Bifidobacterium sp.]|jgi:AcrR family transcriptional regulator
MDTQGSHRGGGQRRGRPTGTESTTRHDILVAAKKDFAANGFRGTTIRGIAHRAGCNARLVHYYFGGKEELFSAAIRETYNQRGLLSLLIASEEQGRSVSGERFLNVFLREIETPDFGDSYLALVRELGTNEQVRHIFERFIQEQIIDRILERHTIDHARQRINAVGTQVLGLVMVRYIMKTEPLASIPIPQVAAVIGPTLDRYLYGKLPVPMQHENAPSSPAGHGRR